MRYRAISNFLFSKNRQKLARQLPLHSLVIVNSNDEMPRSADQFFPFRQNSDFFYLTGIEQPKSILCLCPDFTDHHYREILFIEKPSEHKLTWNGHMITPAQAQEISDIRSIRWLDEFEGILGDLMQHARKVYLSYHETARSFDEVPLRDIRFAEKLRDTFPLHPYERLSPIMAKLRTIKEPEEIACIQQAITITERAFQKILQNVKPNIYEYQVEAEIIAEFLRNGSSGHAFQPIVASGINACVLHYNQNSSVCTNGNLLLIDFGAEYANYNADITRTLPVNGKFTPRQLEVYQAVHDLHNIALSFMKPGISLEKINQNMVPFFEEKIIQLGLVTADEIKHQDPEKPVFKKYFMHGIGHFLGLDVHDTGSKQDTLEPGMIITCEPGLYIRNEEIGIRLENNILITHNGNINLSASIPIEADEIEELMAKVNSIN